MHTDGKAETLRLMLRTASGLRVMADHALDSREADLFLRGALVLERCAQVLAYGEDVFRPEIAAQIDLTC